jgi:hypothetical protein
MTQLRRTFTIKELNILANMSVSYKDPDAIDYQIQLLKFLSDCYKNGGWSDCANLDNYKQDAEGFYIREDGTRVAQIVKSDPARARYLKRLANVLEKKNSIYFRKDEDNWFDSLPVLGAHPKKIAALKQINQIKKPAIVVFYKGDGRANADKTLCFLDDDEATTQYVLHQRSFRFDSTIKAKDILADEDKDVHNQNLYFLQKQICASIEPSEQTHMGTTHQLYRALSWYNYFRIFSIGIYLVLRGLLDFSPVATQIGHAIFGFAGLVFALEIILDTAMLIRAGREATNGETEKLVPWYKRVWNTFKKDGRSARMINAVLWFGINLACFILTGGIFSPVALIETTVANLIGFGLDLVNSAVHSTHTVKRLDSIHKKTEERLAKPKANNAEDNSERQWLEARLEIPPPKPETPEPKSAIVTKKEGAAFDRRLGIFLVVLSLLAGAGTFMATGISLGLFSIGVPVFVCTLVTAGFYLLNGSGLIGRRIANQTPIPEPKELTIPPPGSTPGSDLDPRPSSSTLHTVDILGIDLRTVVVRNTVEMNTLTTTSTAKTDAMAMKSNSSEGNVISRSTL